MSQDKIIDHLFRHQYGKMVSILTRIFGFSNLEIIEDAVQDTFLKATHTWKDSIPENPEAWLTQAAKNRTIDLFRKIKADKTRIQNLDSGPSAIALNELFLDHEIEDSQLRMIFACCHPALQNKDQIAFALKTISGFNQKEIAAALLTKEESIKKRLQRARKTIVEQSIRFEIPSGNELESRMDNVVQVIYLIFNEGFHSNGKNNILRKDLCGEGLRLCKMILNKESLRGNSIYSLFALMCFNSSRLETKVTDDIVVELKYQNRKKWYQPLIDIGNNSLQKAASYPTLSSYFYEASIAFQHSNAKLYTETDWKKIAFLYGKLYKTYPSDFIILNQAIALLQLKNYEEVELKLESINALLLEQKQHLYHAVYTDFYISQNKIDKAKESIQLTIKLSQNEKEKQYFIKKFASII